MTRGKHQRRGEHRAIGSLGLSLLVHGASLGALVALGGAFALAVQDRPRQLTFESPSLADLLEQPAPEDLTEVARAEETLEPEEEPLHDPAAFSDTWVVAPDLPGELPADELLDEPPADDSQMYCSSSLCFDTTTTRSATRYEE